MGVFRVDLEFSTLLVGTIESLEIFGEEVLPQFSPSAEEKVAEKNEKLAPYIEAALERKEYMKPLADDEIPIVPPSQEREAFYVRE